jgi:hypothetical protein
VRGSGLLPTSAHHKGRLWHEALENVLSEDCIGMIPRKLSYAYVSASNFKLLLHGGDPQVDNG